MGPMSRRLMQLDLRRAVRALDLASPVVVVIAGLVLALQVFVPGGLKALLP